MISNIDAGNYYLNREELHKLSFSYATQHDQAFSGENNYHASKIPPTRPHGPRISALITVLSIAALIGISTVKNISGNSVAYTVGDQKITKNDINKAVVEASKDGYSREQAISNYLETEKLRQVALSQNIDSINADNFNNLKNSIGNSGYKQLLATNIAIRDELQKNKVTRYVGAYYVFPFSTNITGSSDGGDRPAVGDQKQIDLDKKYALEQANITRQALLNNTINPAQAVSNIVNNEKLSYPDAQNQSREFINMPADIVGWYREPIFEPALSFIKSYNKEGISPIQTIQIKDKNGKLVDAIFYFVQIREIKQPKSIDIDSEVNNIKVEEHV